MMKSINLSRIIFEKIFIYNSLKSNIWLIYVYLEIKKGYIIHVKKILKRILTCFKKKSHLNQNLYFFFKIFFSSDFLLNSIYMSSNLWSIKEFLPLKFNCLRLFDQIIHFTDFYKKKFNTYFICKDILNLFSIEIKIGKSENSIYFFQILYLNKKYLFSLKFFEKVIRLITPIVDKSTKLVVLKNFFYIYKKIENNVYIFQIKKKLFDIKIVYFFLKKFNYKIQRFNFLNKLFLKILNSILSSYYYKKKKLNLCIFNSTQKFFKKNIEYQYYFKILKTSLIIYFSNLHSKFSKRLKFKSLLFFVNNIIKDQFFLDNNISSNQINKLFVSSKFINYFLFFKNIGIFLINDNLNKKQPFNKILIYFFLNNFDQKCYLLQFSLENNFNLSFIKFFLVFKQRFLPSFNTSLNYINSIEKNNFIILFTKIKLYT